MLSHDDAHYKRAPSHASLTLVRLSRTSHSHRVLRILRVSLRFFAFLCVLIAFLRVSLHLSHVSPRTFAHPSDYKGLSYIWFCVQ